MNRTNTLRWLARIWGTLILAFVLFFLLAHIFGEESSEELRNALRNAREVITFLLFPIGTVVGLGIALRWEGLGGLIATISVIGLFILRPDLISAPWLILGIAPPGILYILYWFLSRLESDTGAGATT